MNFDIEKIIAVEISRTIARMPSYSIIAGTLMIYALIQYEIILKVPFWTPPAGAEGESQNRVFQEDLEKGLRMQKKMAAAKNKKRSKS